MSGRAEKLSDEELAKLVPWNETVQAACSGVM